MVWRWRHDVPPVVSGRYGRRSRLTGARRSFSAGVDVLEEVIAIFFELLDPTLDDVADTHHSD